jgi:hypothetical protein
MTKAVPILVVASLPVGRGSEGSHADVDRTFAYARMANDRLLMGRVVDLAAAMNLEHPQLPGYR